MAQCQKSGQRIEADKRMGRLPVSATFIRFAKQSADHCSQQEVF
jgi:hypothetical protein